MTFIITDPDGSQPTTTTNGTDPAHSKVHDDMGHTSNSQNMQTATGICFKRFRKEKMGKGQRNRGNKIIKKQGGNHVGHHTCKIEIKHEHTTS